MTTPSLQQQAIFDWFEEGTGNLVVRARAGTGKTTTIIAGASRAPERRILLAAFNKKIADELNGRCKSPAVEAKTLHSLGFGFIIRNWPGVSVDPKRGYQLARRVMGLDAPEQMVTLVEKLAGKGKNTLIDPTIDKLVRAAAVFDLMPDEEWKKDGWDTEKIAELALRTMNLALERDGTIDFDDMIYVAVRNRMARRLYGLIIIDEAQDMGAVQLQLAQDALIETGRMCVVGDDRQAIYGFRGADSNSIDRLKQELAAPEMPLTVTYRCPRIIVAYAAKLVPDFVAADSVAEGIIESCIADKVPDFAVPGDFVLSRTNAPLATMCLRLIRAGIPAKIEGRDIGQSLMAIVRKLKRRGPFTSKADIVERLKAYEERERLSIAKSKDETSAIIAIANLGDKCDTMRCVLDGIETHTELEQRLQTMFADAAASTNAVVVCSSVHRSKGLETDNVFVLKDTLYPKRGMTANISLEEQNIEYVAVTRAKRKLTWVHGS